MSKTESEHGLHTKKHRKYKEKVIGKMKIVGDFLPKPKDLVLKKEQLYCRRLESLNLPRRLRKSFVWSE